jgi:type IV secretory pathway protease TraF
LDYKEINILGNTLPVIERADSFGRHIPVNNGSWNGEHGNSFWYPNSDVILKDMRYYGIRK